MKNEIVKVNTKRNNGAVTWLWTRLDHTLTLRFRDSTVVCHIEIAAWMDGTARNNKGAYRGRD